MSEKNWTPDQRDAIEARGGTLLVSAAAGSGKTAVLVERVIRRITGDDPCDVDRLLVVTFTNAAAAEMKERISSRLGDLIAANPADRSLQRQQVLLQNAHIQTIHSFCLELIRENFEKLDVPPDFRIADENEARILCQDVLAQLLEEKYAASAAQREPDDFRALAEMLGAGRDDSLLEDTVLRLYDFVRSMPDPEGTLDGMLRMYAPGVPAGRTVWGKAALRHVERTMESAAAQIEGSLRIIAGYGQLIDKYQAAFSGDLNQARECAQAARTGDWDRVRAMAAGFDFAPLGPVRKFEAPEVKDALQAQRKSFKETVGKLCDGVLCCSEAQFAQDLATVYPVAACLFGIVLELDKRLFEAKIAKNMLDFGDLEQLALKLLIETPLDDGPRPTACARAVSRRFEEVLVDEYQDTNRAQDAIFRAVSREGRNLFMVGDVKQSIYRFRRATPELFMEKQDAFAPYHAGRFPARIILGRNFRSRAGITSAVNFVFSQLMSREFGEIDYGDDERLIPGASYPERPGADFELHVVDAKAAADDADMENDDRDTLEARHIAGVIRDMMREQFPVQGENGPRPVRYRDFCILLRSTAGRAETCRRELEHAGIPVFADVAGGYLGSYEVAVTLSLLRILDNPLQDVPLLSVMLSPVFGFTPDDLARVRVTNRKGSLYLALVSFAREAGGAFASFLDTLSSLRRVAAVLPADRLLLRIYAQTGLPEIFEAMPAGAARRANLRLLLDYARGYESAGYKGLPGFIRYIDRLSSQDGDLVPASAVSENADVVRIMSIHKSKGLEFPVCILAGCARRFNMEDTQRPVLFHPVYGFGAMVRDAQRGLRTTTLPREVVRMETARSGLAEEMRVLYVAMTRAKEKLICVMTPSNVSSTLHRASGLLREGRILLDPLAASQSQSFSEWLLACTLRHPAAGELRRLAGCEDIALLPESSPLKVCVTAPETAGPSLGREETKRGDRPCDADEEAGLAREIRRRIAARYPDRVLSRVPSKVAVSELAEAEVRREFGFRGSPPAFLSPARLTPAQAGTALHEFMQYAELSRIRTADDVTAEVRRLVDARFLLPEQGDAVRAEKVLGYLQSDLYARVKNASRVWKEFRFTVEADASRISPDAQPGHGTAVIQGMADVVFEENGRIYLLDYKTDAADEEELRRRYMGQLAIYANAVAQIMGKNVSVCYIYGFHAGKTVVL